MAKSLIDAVRYLHLQGIIHRDIKPENIFIRDKNEGLKQVKLADFGMAKLLGERSYAETVCGSPNYVAPEVIA
jgi:serine/threonine protein kinase